MSDIIYLDNAATTPLAVPVLKGTREFLQKTYANASSGHQLGRLAREEIEKVRGEIAKEINALPEEIIFTSGGTESNNLVIKGLVESNPDKKHFITSVIEHPAILEPMNELKKRGYKVDYAPVSKEGIVDVEFIKNKITSQTLLVSIMHVNNEIGTIQPIEEIAKICKEKKVPFHTDAVQSFGKLKIDVSKGIDFLSASGHKINGPKGIGFLYVRNGIKLTPLFYGGGQEKGLRSGTENTTGIVGLGEALKLKRQPEKISVARDKLLKEILKISHSYLNGSLKNRIYNNINVSFYGIEGESLLLLLDKSGICVSTGSACSSHKLQESHVLKAINVNPLCIHGSIRLTLDTLKPLSGKEIKFVASKIKEAVIKLREISPFKIPGDFDKQEFKSEEECYMEEE